MLFLSALLGALIYRLRGMGAWPNKRLWVGLFALPYAYIAYEFGGWWLAIPVFGITFGMILTGHASYIDLGRVKPGAPNSPADGQIDEWYGHWLPFEPASHEHDFLGLCVNGMLITGSAALAVIYSGNTKVGLLILFSGLLKAPSYLIAWLIQERFKIRDGVMVGEIICGAALWGSLAAINLHAL